MVTPTASFPQAVDQIREYAAIQRRLCGALFATFAVRDMHFLTDLPKHGVLRVGDELWEFRRHGTGVSFTQAGSKIVVDAHAGMVAYAGGVDACRLVQYFESLGVKTLVHGHARFCTAEENSVNNLLRVLCDDGVLVTPVSSDKIYCLVA